MSLGRNTWLKGVWGLQFDTNNHNGRNQDRSHLLIWDDDTEPPLLCTHSDALLALTGPIW